MIDPPEFTCFRGQPGSCALAQEHAIRKNPKIPINLFMYRMTISFFAARIQETFSSLCGSFHFLMLACSSVSLYAT
jgi:hypothetical protein